MSTPTKQRATKWNDGDKAKFMQLHRENKIDIKSTDPAYIYRVRDKYWPERKNKTFLANWKSSVSNIHVQGSLNGARAAAAAANTTEEVNDIDGEDIDMAASIDDDLAGAFGNSSICKLHSLKKVVPYMISTYPKGDKNICEVEINTDGFYPNEEGFETVVSDDRNSLFVAVGTSKMFASLPRKGKQLANAFHEQDVRYNAFGESVQKVRKSDKEKLKGDYYFEDKQEIILPFPCERTIVKKKLHHHPVNRHEVVTERGPQEHYQFKTWYTICLEGVERRIGLEHAAHSATYDYTPDEVRPDDSDEEYD